MIEVANGVEIWCGEGGYDVQLTEDLEANIFAFLDRCVEHGVTRLFPASNRRDTFPRFINFKESYSEPVYTLKDFYAEWDPLKALIAAAHEREIEVHPYINVNSHGSLRPSPGSSLNGSEFDSPVESWLVMMDTSRFASEHPEFWKRDRSGRNSFDVARNIRLSPAFEAVRQYEEDLLLEFVEEFGVDGIQLEFVSEPTDENGVNVYGYESRAVEEFEQAYGKSPLEIDNSNPDWIRFRCEYVNTFVRNLRARLKQQSCPVPLSAAIIASDPGDYPKTLVDWPAWMNEGLIDGVYLWFREAVDVEEITSQTRDAVKLIDRACPLVAELSCYHRGSFKTAESLREGAGLAREGGADAVGVYRSDPIEALDLWSTVEEIGADNRLRCNERRAT